MAAGRAPDGSHRSRHSHRGRSTFENTGGDMTHLKGNKSVFGASAYALRTALLLVLAVPSIHAIAAQTVPPEIQAIVDSPDRSQADRETDKRRHPADLLAFSGVKPGMSVLDIGSGKGYGAELMARAVGPK